VVGVGQAVVVEGLRKDYGPLCAVADLSFSIESGEVFALLGPNGAGKTTTVEILEGFRPRTAGTVCVLGLDPATGGRALRERIGIVLQTAGFDEEFRVREVVEMYAGLYPRPHDPTALIDLVGLADKRDARIGTLSGGQRRRLDLALGLVGNPELLFLDEPTTGFDPGARRKAWDLVAELRQLGTTILLTTHYMEEAERLADRVAVMDHGRLVAIGTPDQLRARDGDEAVITFRLPSDVALGDLPGAGTASRQVADVVEVSSSRPTADVAVLTGWASERGLELAGLSVRRPSLEHVYLDLVDAEQVAAVEAAAQDRG
jgi:ABC-2 type transport system ATP-binding protein